MVNIINVLEVWLRDVLKDYPVSWERLAYDERGNKRESDEPQEIYARYGDTDHSWLVRVFVWRDDDTVRYQLFKPGDTKWHNILKRGVIDINDPEQLKETEAIIRAWAEKHIG